MKRWPIVRHIRYWLLRGRVTRALTKYGRHGYLIANIDDVLLLQRVWKGEA